MWYNLLFFLFFFLDENKGFGMEFKAHMNKGLSGDLKVAIIIPPITIFSFMLHTATVNRCGSL